MKFESPEDKRLNESEAQEEAAMMRAKLGVPPEISKIAESKWDPDKQLLSFETREATAEEYDDALAALQEMKRIAAEEPTFERILNKLQDIPVKAYSGLQLALQTLGVMHLNGWPHHQRTEEFKEAWKSHQAIQKIKIIDRFQSAENKLEALKARAKN